MARSIWKVPYTHRSLFDFSKNNKKIWDRSSTIIKNMVNLRYQVYNGYKFFPLTITENMVGFKFGEFIQTRKRYIPKKKNIKIRKK